MTASSWRLAWKERPSEEANNFNPAFCAELIARAVGDFHKVREVPLNIAFAFLLPPLTLHKATREALPVRANVAFAGWVADNGALLAELAERACRLRPVSREGLLFGLCQELLAVDNGGLVPGRRPLSATSISRSLTDETRAARTAAALLGRWFAAQTNQYSVLQGMGLTP